LEAIVALNIMDPRAVQLVRDYAEARGLSLTAAVQEAMEQAAARNASTLERTLRRERIHAIAEACAALPTLDRRSEDEILGYDQNGLPQ
jgi:antitoxin VapB